MLYNTPTMDIWYKAWTRLLIELEFEQHMHHPYSFPYANYSYCWGEYLPIKTIIIGQNPYPHHIYPIYGSALAYDDLKQKRPTASVAVLAEDLYNYDSTPKQYTVDCFKNSWKLLEIGVLMINESVFQRICKEEDRLNTGPLREMEAQIRAIQVLISQSFSIGQTAITCVGMGTSGAMMTSIMRPWVPKDLISCKVITCRNPAAFARQLSDSSSQQITIQKAAVSKILSTIVKSYMKMPPSRQSPADKRKQSNIDALNNVSNEIKAISAQQSTELRSFQSRLHAASEDPAIVATLSEFGDSFGSCVSSNERFANAITSYNMTLIMAINSLPKSQDGDKSSNNNTNFQSPAPRTPVAPTGKPNRRVSPRTPLTLMSNVESIKEEESVEDISLKSLSIAPSKARRRKVPMAPSSIADTEYTIDSAVDNSNTTETKINEVDAVHVRSFADWCEQNVSDPTYAEMLRSSATDQAPVNEFCIKVIEYIRSRKREDPSYDSYDELDSESSPSSEWIRELTDSN